MLGGKGINVSGVLAQLGCGSVALGFVAGETGAWLERGLAAQGMKTDFVHLEQGMTRINVKIKAGQETELNGAGPDIPESAMQELEKKLDRLNKDDILILAGSIPSEPAAGYLRAAAGPAAGQGRARGGGCHPRPAGECAAVSPLPHQAQQPRAGRDRGQGADKQRKRSLLRPAPCRKRAPATCW